MAAVHVRLHFNQSINLQSGQNESVFYQAEVVQRTIRNR